MSRDKPIRNDGPQDEVFNFLIGAGSRDDDAVKRIDTHAAVVFLSRSRVLKVKRAVKFPFLDYSTLDKRKAACAAEIAANRRFAPDLYLGVLAVTREADGSLAIGGRGEPVEWAVEMPRFDETRTFDRLADRGELDTAFASPLGHMAAQAHAEAPVVAAGPWIAALGSYIGQNDDAFRDFPAMFEPAAVANLTQQSRAALDRIRPLLEARGQRGLVRRGHGDLHLGNIALIDGRPVAFDAIEFDPVIASGDVLYDLAFLLMDLIERSLADAANGVLNQYLGETRRSEDLEGLAALPFFLSLRAAIRASVTGARLNFENANDREPIAALAVSYFRLASELIAPSPPVLIAVGGLSGTGKSVLARKLAPHLAPAPGAVVLRSDVERKALFGCGKTDPLSAEAYTRDVTARVYGVLADTARRAVKAGHAVVVDAVFARPDERRLVAEAASAAGVSFRGVFLSADLATRMSRVEARRNDASDADAGVAQQQEAYDLGETDWHEVDASGTPPQTLRQVLTLLGLEPR